MTKPALLSLLMLVGVALGANELQIPTKGNFYAGNYSFDFTIREEQLTPKDCTDVLAVYYGTHSTQNLFANGYVLRLNPNTGNITLTVGRGTMANIGPEQAPIISENTTFSYQDSVTFKTTLKQNGSYTIYCKGENGKQTITLAGPGIPVETQSYNGNMNGGTEHTDISSVFNKDYLSAGFGAATSNKFARKDIGSYRAISLCLKDAIANKRLDLKGFSEQLQNKLVLQSISIRMGHNGAQTNGMAALLVHKESGTIVAVSDRKSTKNDTITHLKFTSDVPISAEDKYLIYFTHIPEEQLKGVLGNKLNASHISEFRFATRQVCEPHEATAAKAASWGWATSAGTSFGHSMWAPAASLQLTAYAEPALSPEEAVRLEEYNRIDELTDTSLSWLIAASLLLMLGLVIQWFWAKLLIARQRQQREKGERVTWHKPLLVKFGSATGAVMLAALICYIIYFFCPTTQLHRAKITNEYAQLALFRAAETGNSQQLNQLIRAGACSHKKDLKGLTALHHAVLNNHPENVALLLAAPDCNQSGWPELHLAIVANQHSEAAHLLSNGHAANSRDAQGYTPLHLAAALNRYQCVELLLSTCNADVNATTPEGDTALHLAARLNCPESIALLTKHRDTIVNRKNSAGLTPIQEAAQAGSPDSIKALAASEKCDLNVRGESSVSLLHLAVMNAHPLTLAELLNTGKLDVNARDMYGQTALHLAAEEGRTRCLETLLKSKGVDLNILRTEGSTALHLACEKGMADCAILLLNTPSCDIDKAAENYRKNTPLHLAAGCMDASIVTELLKRGVKNINAPNRNGETPLHNAAAAKRTEIVEQLLEADGINTIATNQDGQTPLHYALEAGASDIVRLLCKAGGDKVGKDNMPIIELISQGNIKRFKKLVKLGLCDFSKPAKYNAWSDERTIPPFFAIRHGHSEAACLMIDEIGDEIATLRDEDGNNLLHAAALNGDAKVLEVLLDTGLFPINEVNGVGATALRCAVTANSPECVELLLDESGVDVNLGNKDGNTPLHKAAARGYTRCAELLLDCDDIDINKTNKAGESPLVWACRETQIEVWAQLLRAGNTKADITAELAIAAAKNDCDKAQEIIAKNDTIHSQTLAGMLAFAIQKNRPELLKALLTSRNCNPNAIIEEKSLLYIAAENGRTDCLKVLLEASRIRPNLPNPDWNGDTPLLVAIRKGFNDCATALLEHKDIDVNYKEPLIEALKANNEEICILILTHPDTKPEVYEQNLIVSAISHNSSRCLPLLLTDKRISQSGLTKELIALITQDPSKLNQLALSGIDFFKYDRKWHKSLISIAVGLHLHDSLRTLLRMPEVDVNQQEGWENTTLLHKAVEAGNITAVKLLTAHPNIKHNVRDAHMRTALEYADEKAPNISKDMKKRRSICSGILRRTQP